ncbi:MAG TPA: chorismate mutase [Terriglobia bacterium]|nr:chorismate mutase [Terriglobia bacterium]
MTMIVGHLRQQIDAIDAQLLDLLNRRAEVALELGRHKRGSGLELRDVEREAQILSRARELNAGPLEPAAVERVFRAILAESRRAQSNQAQTNGGSLAHARSRSPKTGHFRSLQCA